MDIKIISGDEEMKRCIVVAEIELKSQLNL